jgi:transcriptional regulator with GAF, ATPase, and Fis domain
LEEVVVPGITSKSAVNPEQEIRILCEISQMAQKSGASVDLIEDILRTLGQIIDFRAASIYMFSRANDKLEEICNIGRRADLIDFVSFELGNGISAWVAKHKRPIVLNNLRKSKGGTRTRSFLSVPIIFGGVTRGVINLSHDEPDSYIRRDADVVGIVGSLVALVIERVKTQSELQALEQEIESLRRELDLGRAMKSTGERARIPGNMAEAINQEIANPLAIISGNAQFLMMTMKGSGQSVLRRLKAIDKEASNIMAATRNFTGSQVENTGQAAPRHDKRLVIHARRGIEKN